MESSNTMCLAHQNCLSHVHSIHFLGQLRIDHPKTLVWKQFWNLGKENHGHQQRRWKINLKISPYFHPFVYTECVYFSLLLLLAKSWNSCKFCWIVSNNIHFFHSLPQLRFFNITVVFLQSLSPLYYLSFYLQPWSWSPGLCSLWICSSLSEQI